MAVQLKSREAKIGPKGRLHNLWSSVIGGGLDTLTSHGGDLNITSTPPVEAQPEVTWDDTGEYEPATPGSPGTFKATPASTWKNILSGGQASARAQRLNDAVAGQMALLPIQGSYAKQNAHDILKDTYEQAHQYSPIATQDEVNRQNALIHGEARKTALTTRAARYGTTDEENPDLLLSLNTYNNSNLATQNDVEINKGITARSERDLIPNVVQSGQQAMISGNKLSAGTSDNLIPRIPLRNDLEDASARNRVEAGQAAIAQATLQNKALAGTPGALGYTDFDPNKAYVRSQMLENLSKMAGDSGVMFNPFHPSNIKETVINNKVIGREGSPATPGGYRPLNNPSPNVGPPSQSELNLIRGAAKPQAPGAGQSLADLIPSSITPAITNVLRQARTSNQAETPNLPEDLTNNIPYPEPAGPILPEPPSRTFKTSSPERIGQIQQATLNQLKKLLIPQLGEIGPEIILNLLSRGAEEKDRRLEDQQKKTKKK